MAMTFHSIERLGRPFVSVSELGLVIPQHGEILVNNPEVKILFFLHADCVQEIDQGGIFPIRTGDILIIPRVCRQHYRNVSVQGSPRIHVLKLSLNTPPLPPPGHETSRRATKANPEADLSAFAQHHLTEIRHLPGAQDAPMREILLAIRREAEEHRPGIRHRVRALCTNLLVHVARRSHESPPPRKAKAPGHGFVVNQAKEFLLRNFARPLKLGDVAWHVKMSEEHLARIFRKVTGQTIFDYLLTVRLESAKTLLIDSSYTLTEIAQRTGFSSLSLFSRNFGRYVGVSASRYRGQLAQRTHWEAPAKSHRSQET